MISENKLCIEKQGDITMSFHAHKGSSREQGYTPLEETTRHNREEHAAKSPEKIAKTKERRERRAAHKAAVMELDSHFAAAVASDPGKITIAGLSLSQKFAESHLPYPEKVWLERISAQTETYIFRKDQNCVAIRGLPANLALAKTRIQEDVAMMSHKTSPVPQ
jgi:hypothetical protein